MSNDMWDSFKGMALVYLGGGLAALIGAGTILPLVIIGVALAILVKVFGSFGS